MVYTVEVCIEKEGTVYGKFLRKICNPMLYDFNLQKGGTLLKINKMTDNDGITHRINLYMLLRLRQGHKE